MQIYVNYVTVLGAAIASILIGIAWYSHMGFGNKWKKYMGWVPGSEEDMKKGMAKRYTINLVANFVMAFVLAYFIKILGVTTVSGAIILTLWLWLGFILPTAIGEVLWAKKPWGLYFINVFYSLISIYVMALILTFWG